MLSPFLAIFCVTLSFCTVFSIYYYTSINATEYFFLPIFFLVLYYTIVIQLTQQRDYQLRPAHLALKKGVGKYIFWFVLIGCLYAVYSVHPFYNKFTPNTRVMLEWFVKIYAVAGLPYFFYVERYRYGDFEKRNDSYLKILSFLRLLATKNWQRLKYRLFVKGYKSLFLSWFVRLHFIPLMVEQVFMGTISVLAVLSNPSYEYTVLSTILLLITFLYLIDATNASIGYFWESFLTKTNFRAIDPYPFHWIIVLMCYYPFIKYAQDFVKFPKGNLETALVVLHPTFEIAVNAASALALLGIVLSTTCLGFSYSNLSYKKIQTKGPYAVVRHPGTVFKLIFFFLIAFRFKQSYALPVIMNYIFWASVYLTRAICEERFLKQFGEYRDYMAVTRYRFIPGVV